MRSGLRLLGVVAAALIAGNAAAEPTRSSTLAVAPNDVVFAVNPDSDTVARLAFDGAHAGTLTAESPVGDYPRTVALAGSWVYTADQHTDTVSRLAQADLGGLQQVDLGTGCAPYGIAPTPDGQRLVVSCQGTSEAVLLDTGLSILGRVPLQWSNARAIAVSSDGTKAYVTHYLTEEPNHDAHVSEVDLPSRTVSRVLAVPADLTTCETQNSGQGVLNLVSTIAIMPDGAPPEVAGQLWVGGTQQNNVSKGLFKRWQGFKDQQGSGLFPWLTYKPFPELGGTRNVYKPSFHDVTRFGIYKLDIASGNVVGKIDIDEANNATDVEFSPDGRAAYVVDLMFNSYHMFNTGRGQDGNPTTLFAAVSMNGPGGAEPSAPCIAEPLRSVTSERPFRVSPQAEISILDPINPVTPDFVAKATGVDFDAKHYMETDPHEARMRAVPDGIGTAPMGVRVSANGQTVFVANYLSRNVVPVAAAAPQAGMIDGEPTFQNLRCSGPPNQPCGTSNHCGGGTGFCNHPGGAACQNDADCTSQGAPGPCVLQSVCVPLLLGAPVSSITGGIDADPLQPQLLDGKILFNTAARDASVTNSVGLGDYAPLFLNSNDEGNMMDMGGGNMQPVPGAVVSTAHDASYVTCTACHADFGGQDGRTWDFSQFGSSLRNTMDLRGRAGFAPGRCDGGTNDGGECFFDAACGPGGFCRAQESMIPPNIVGAANRQRWFNPMLTVHWNGDRDEVEDFEHTYRSLLGSGDCDGIEDGPTCQGALIQRSPDTSGDPADVHPDLGEPNRNIPGPNTGMNAGIRLTNMADFVYSLTEFVENPNPVTEETELGRALFNDPQTECASCHNGGPGAGEQFFTDKRPNPSFDVNAPGRADGNNPFLRHDVGTANLFDLTDPLAVAQENQTFQNPRTPIPGSRGALGDYVTPVLNDLWNTRPYLHDGSAHTLLDVVRPCDTAENDCYRAGAGRNLNGLHGTTHMLTPQQLNALAAFQDSLRLDTVVGDSQPTIVAGTLDLKKVKVVFPKTKKDGSRKGSAKFVVRGTVTGGSGDTDPSQGVTFTLATPGGQRMAIFSRDIVMQGSGRSFRGTSTDGGVVKVKLRRKGDGYTLAANGKKLDLSILETGNDDFTVALEVGPKQFVKNRILSAKKHVRRLPKKSRRR